MNEDEKAQSEQVNVNLQYAALVKDPSSLRITIYRQSEQGTAFVGDDGIRSISMALVTHDGACDIHDALKQDGTWACAYPFNAIAVGGEVTLKIAIEFETSIRFKGMLKRLASGEPEWLDMVVKIYNGKKMLYPSPKLFYWDVEGDHNEWLSVFKVGLDKEKACFYVSELETYR